jgi:hypothetical protein
LSRQDAQQYTQRVANAVQWARSHLQRAQEAQAKQANRRRREPDFIVGDKVYVTRKGWATDRPSIKLDRQNAGPYKIVAMRGYSYELDLPEYMKMHPVFSADRLRKAPDNPLPGQEEPPEPPIEINGEPEYTVQEILDSRIHRGKLQYKANWAGYDPDDQFYNAEGFAHAPNLVQDFHNQYPNAAGPPVRLPIWLQAKLRGDTLITGPDDNAAIQKTSKPRRKRKTQGR